MSKTERDLTIPSRPPARPDVLLGSRHPGAAPAPPGRTFARRLDALARDLDALLKAGGHVGRPYLVGLANELMSLSRDARHLADDGTTIPPAPRSAGGTR